MGKKKILPDYLKGTTVGGGVNVYDDEYVTSPKIDLNVKRKSSQLRTEKMQL